MSDDQADDKGLGGLANFQGHGERRLEVGHVLFMDVVGYSKLMMEDQRRTLAELQETVRESDEFRAATQENRLIRLPTGDGMALVFFGDPEAPLRAAVELSRALRSHPALKLRMGIHSGPVYRVEDINANLNVAGGGVNVAQRVMDCGDAGHILVSEDSARFFLQVGKWADALHDLGKTRVKHGVRLHLFSLFVSEVGNPRLPLKLRRERVRRRGVAGAVLTGLVVGLIVLLWTIAETRHERRPVFTHLTTNPANRPAKAAAISPDGQYLAYVDPQGVFLRNVQSGEEKALPTPEGATLSSPDWAVGWFPDSSKLVVSGPAGPEKLESLWLLRLVVGAPLQPIAKKAWFPSIAPDGSKIAFIDAETEQTIWVAGPEGQDVTRLLSAPKGNSFDSICWSPAGGRLAFVESGPDPDNDFIGTVDTRGKVTTLLKDKYLGSALTWLADSRIVFVRDNPGRSRGDNLWAITTDPRSGEATGRLTQITDEADVDHSDLSSTKDGNRLAFLRGRSHEEVWLGNLGITGKSLTGAREFISEESNNWATGWTPDSRYVLFSSDRRGGVIDIFRQSVFNGSVEPLLPTGSDIRSGAVALSGGTSYLYWSWPRERGDFPKTNTLMELDLRERFPSRILDNKPYKSQVRCAPTAPICVISDELNGGLRFSQLDLRNRREEYLASLTLAVADGYDWDLSPDGRSVAAVHHDLSDNVVRLLTLADKTPRQLPIGAWSEFDYVGWAADGEGVYLAANLPKKVALLHVNLKGDVDVIWQSESATLDELVPSPDGKFVAFTVRLPGESNAWVIDRF